MRSSFQIRSHFLPCCRFIAVVVAAVGTVLVVAVDLLTIGVVASCMLVAAVSAESLLTIAHYVASIV